MADFDFRIEFRLPGADHIQFEGEELLLLQEPNGRQLRLCFGQRGTPIAGRSNAVVRGGPYSSSDEARQSAERAKRALLIWAVQTRIGIDLGDGHPRSVITNAGEQWIETRLGRPVRNAVLGIDVFEHQDDLAFARLEGRLSLGKSPGVFRDSVVAAFTSPPALTEKHLLAADIYSASFFDVSFRSRLITLVTALEALLERADRPAPARALVAKMQVMVQKAALNESTKKAMISSLQWLNHDSIGEAGRALARSLLGHSQYLGKPAPEFFNYCYGLRSQILHSGTPEDAAVDLSTVSGECQRFVGDLLIASFGVVP